MTDDEWDALETDQDPPQFRWVWNNPATAEQRIGATLHKSRSAAIRAGRSWLAKRPR